MNGESNNVVCTHVLKHNSNANTLSPLMPACLFWWREETRWMLIQSPGHSQNIFEILEKKPRFHQYEMQTVWNITYFCWCLVYTCYSWYFGSAHVSLSGWWCMLHSRASHRCYMIPCLRGAPCVSVVCLWWQRQQCTSAWGRKTFFKYRLSCSTHFKVRIFYTSPYPRQQAGWTSIIVIACVTENHRAY